MSAAADRIAALPPEKQRALLAQIERDGGAAGLYLLSFAQQRLWFLDRLAPGTALYNMPAAFRLTGPLDPAAFAAAASEVVRRHEGLRTTFLKLADQPVQLVGPPAPVPVPLADLSALPAGEREAEAERLLAAGARAPFDLGRGPLLRLVLVRLDPRSHLALLTLHHIAADGWSIGVFLRELAALYEAARAGRPSPLPPLPIQYRDYARWQRRTLQGERLEAEIAHWRGRLAGAPPETELPRDRPRPAVPSFRGEVVPLALAAADVAALRALGAGLGATPFMTVLAAFAAVLRRHAGQDDLAVGTVVANRDRPEIEGLIGFFVNTLVLRADLSGDPTFRGLVGRLREVTLDAYAHQDLPFEKLVEALQPERSVNRSPLFQVVFDLQNLPVAPRGGGPGGLAIAALDAQTGTSKFDLRLALQDTGSGLAGGLEYAADLFDRATVLRIAAHLERLVAAAARRPDDPLSALDPLSPAERHQAAAEWNDTSAAEAAATAHGLIAAQARRTPRAVAVLGPGGPLTYAALEERAERLARHLAALGVGPGSVVALWLERSADMVVALLAAWKAGAAYLPLDAASPADRLALVLADARPAALVSRGAMPDRLPRGGFPVVRLDGGWEETPGAGGPLPAVPPEHPAYLIYTSGSTGRPKGVVVPHRGLVNYLLWSSAAYEAGSGAGSLVHSPFAFDLTLTGLLGPLAVGGTVRLLPETDDPEALARALRSVGDLSLVKLTPAHLELLRRQLAPEELPGAARAFVIGGEALYGETLAFFHRHAPATRLINEYGPTETVVGCAIHEVAPGAPLPERVPIGRPIANLRMHVLDRAFDPVPLGAVGELFIGGAGVAQGYLGRPDLTAERFVPDPFASEPGGRLYRTGDLGRRLADGTLTYLGRTDHQVKVRGFRIEPGEVEAALTALPAVDASAVVAAGASTGERRLVAFVVPRPGAAPAEVEEAALKARLAAALPPAMVPSAVRALPELPQTPNGKVDRAALEALASRPAPSAAAAAPPLPAGGLERQVAEVWREVLGRESVGLDESFFELGGHSLLLAEVHGRLSRLGLPELPLIDLFNHPTVRSLARRLAELQGGPREAAAPLLEEPRPRRTGTASGAVAVVGMAVRLPGAATPEDFWRNLAAGVEGVSFFTDEELLAAGVDPALLADPRYVRGKASLPGVELFDAGFFRVNRRQAEVMDPQHRIFLECAWEALEDAGHAGEARPSVTGLFAGKGANGYAALLQANPASVEAVGMAQATLGNEKDHLATHAAYLFDLEGPAVTVQTSCSTSLVAVHLACRSLLAGECDLALAGGSSIDPLPVSGYLYQEGGILSPDGHCRPFDAAAQGTVGGSGAAVVVLRRLEDALREGDPIRAVIRGSAMNNDGTQKVGYTAPRVEGQARVIAAAQRQAGVEPDEVTYVEAHGTGTELGDPIEMGALTRAFRERTDRVGFCGVGSLKSNLGHLDTAAGAAGLIKTVLALEHRLLPPTLHFERPNPKIDLASSPFYVVDRPTPWEPPAGAPRRAGVSSFGIGGTNVHVVVEEAPERPAAAVENPRPRQLLVLSARSEAALEAATDRLAAHLEAHPELPLADVAFTLQTGRRTFPHRRVAVAADSADAVRVLASRDPERTAAFAGDRQGAGCVFLFPGQGVQHPDMGRELYETEPLFRAEVDRCAAILAPELGLDLRDLLFPDPERREEAEERLARTDLGQPALFVVEYALARLLESWLGPPAALIGHSLGEWVAACLAGVFPLEDALRLVALRGRLTEETAPGAMLAVDLPEADLQPRLVPGLSIAALNGPNRTVASGPPEAIAELEERLAGEAVECRRLRSDRAFHSPAMDPAVGPLVAAVRAASLSAPRIPYLSNVTGDWIRPEEATDPAYWGEHLRGAVRFEPALRVLLGATDGPLLEVGPGRTLSSIAGRHPARAADRTVLASIPRPDEAASAAERLTLAVGRLWLAGVRVDWEAFHSGGRPRRVPLPTYPFERQAYWFTPKRSDGSDRSVRSRFTAPGWRRAAEDPRPSGALPPGAWLLLRDDREPWGERIARALERRGAHVVSVSPPGPEGAAGWEEMLAGLARSGHAPAFAVHLWRRDRRRDPEDALRSLRDFAAAFSALPGAADCRAAIVTDGLQGVLGTEGGDAEAGLLLGLCGAPPAAGTRVTFRDFDPVLTGPGAAADDGWIEAMIADLADSAADASIVAFRGRHRWLRSAEPVELALLEPAALPDGAASLVTGGLTPAALGFARALARRPGARIALAAPPDFPPRDAWDRLDEIADGGDEVLAVGLAGQAERWRAAEADLERELGIRVLAERGGLEAAIDRFCSVEVLDYLRREGVDFGRIWGRGELYRHLRVRDELSKLYDACLLMLAEDGFLTDDGATVTFLPAAAAAPGAAELKAELDARWPELRGLYRLIDHCVQSYGPALSGDVPALGVLYPGGTTELLDSVDRETDGTNHEELYLRLLARAVSDLAEAVAPRPLRVLEVGGGSGTLTRRLLPVLAGRPFEYTFTDLGRAFVRRAEVEVAERGFRGVRFQVLDVSQDPVEQGLEPFGFDLVVGLNVVHATRDLGESVGNLRRVLAPGGLLGLVETVKPSRAIDLVWGLTEGWWYFDDDYRDRSPVVSLDTWERALRGQGLAEVALFPGPEAAAARPQDMGMILGQQPLDLEDPRWSERRDARRRERAALLEAAVRGLRALEEAGAEVALLPPSEDPASLAEAARGRFGRLDALVHAAGVPSPAAARALAGLLDRLRPALGVVSLPPVPSDDLDARAAQALLSVLAERESAAPFTLLRWGAVDVPAAEAEEVLGRLLAHHLPEVAVTAAATAAGPAASEAAPAEEGRRPDTASGLTDVQRRLIEIWRDLLGAEVGLHDNFFELGGDSMIAVGLTSRMRDAFGVEVPMRKVLEGPTVAALAALVEEAGPRVAATAGSPAGRARESHPSLVEIQGGNRSRAPFFTVHAAGGNVFSYYGLAGYLGRERPVYALQAPGLEGEGGEVFTRLEELAASHVRAVRSAQPHGPYLLGGWSAGGTVAFEMAQQLRNAGEEVLMVALMDTYAPKTGEDLDETRMLLWQAYRFEMPMTLEELTRFPTYAERLDYLLMRARASGLLREDVDQEQAHRLLSTELRILRAMLNYRPTVLDARLAYFRCTEGTEFGDFAQLFPGINDIDHADAWRDYTTEPMKIYDVPGHHQAMMEEPTVRVLAARLQEAFAEVETAAPAGARSEAP